MMVFLFFAGQIAPCERRERERGATLHTYVLHLTQDDHRAPKKLEYTMDCWVQDTLAGPRGVEKKATAAVS